MDSAAARHHTLNPVESGNPNALSLVTRDEPEPHARPDDGAQGPNGRPRTNRAAPDHGRDATVLRRHSQPVQARTVRAAPATQVHASAGAKPVPATVADRELLDAVVATGDEEAFRELYRRHTPRVYAVVWRLAHGNVQDTEDIVQDAWLRAVRSAASFEWRSGFGSWLTGIAINRARDMFRRRRVVSMTSLANTPEPAAASTDVTGIVDLDRAIAALPLRYRAVLIMHDVEGWPHTEIAAALGISPGTSKSQLFKARRRIRALLERGGHQ